MIKKRSVKNIRSTRRTLDDDVDHDKNNNNTTTTTTTSTSLNNNEVGHDEPQSTTPTITTEFDDDLSYQPSVVIKRRRNNIKSPMKATTPSSTTSATATTTTASSTFSTTTSTTRKSALPGINRHSTIKSKQKTWDHHQKQDQKDKEEDDDKNQFIHKMSDDDEDDDKTAAATTTVIPDALSIRLAKQKRRALQQSSLDGSDQVSQSIIPLSVASDSTTVELMKDHAMLRRVVGDDLAMSDEEDNDGHKKDDNNKYGGAKEDEENEDEEEDKEKTMEFQKWEWEQLKKAGVKNVGQHPMLAKEGVDDEDQVDEHEMILRKMKEKKLKQKMTYYSKQEGEQALLSFSSVESNLKLTLSALEADLEHNQRSLDETNHEIEENATTLSMLKTEMNDVSEQFVFYQRMRDYIEDLVDCLDNKVPEIEQAENQLLVTRSKYHERLYANWLEYMDDMIKLGDEGTNGVERASILERQNKMDQIRRHFAQDADKWNSVIDYSEQQDNPNNVQYVNAVQDLISQVSTIFDDVEADYCQIGNIKHKFEEWREVHPDSYRDTYCNIYVQKVFAPFVRLELLGLPNSAGLKQSSNENKITEVEKWRFNPSQAPTFSIFHWWSTLLNYGVEHVDGAMNDDEDDERRRQEDNLIPELIRKVAIPIIIHTIDHIYNPLSNEDTNNVRRLVSELLDYLDPQSDEMKRVYRSIVKRIARFANDLKCPSFISSHPTQRAIDAVLVSFLRRQLDCLLILVQNSCQWLSVVSEEALRPIISDLILNQTYLSCLFNNNRCYISDSERDQFIFKVLGMNFIPQNWKRDYIGTVKKFQATQGH